MSVLPKVVELVERADIHTCRRGVSQRGVASATPQEKRDPARGRGQPVAAGRGPTTYLRWGERGHERPGTASWVVGRGWSLMVVVVVLLHGLIDGFGGGVALGDPRAQPEGLPAGSHCLPVPASRRIRPGWAGIEDARDGADWVGNISRAVGGGAVVNHSGARSGLCSHTLTHTRKEKEEES